MKMLAVLCNLLSIAFTCLVMATDGPPTKPAYMVFGALLLLVPIFTVYALVRSGAGRAWLSGGAKKPASEGPPVGDLAPSGSGAVERTAAIANLVLIAFLGWAMVDQYPHPDEEGFVAYVVLMLFTPILSAAVLFLSGRRGGRRGSPVEKVSAS